MPTSSKPRKKFNPAKKRICLNPMGYVLEGLTPIEAHGQYLITLKLRNHAALDALVKGRASADDMNTLLAVNNIMAALLAMNIGTEYREVFDAGHDALKAVADRGVPANRFLCYAKEITALNALMELHDAQMEVININQMEAALALAKRKKLPQSFFKKVADK